MRSGELRHRITLLAPSTTLDALKQPTGEPTRFATRWARVRPADAREVATAAQTGSRLSHVVEMRYLAGVRPTMIVEYGDRLFDVNAVVDVGERRRELELRCTERPT